MADSVRSSKRGETCWQAAGPAKHSEIATPATNRSAKDGDIAGQIGALEPLSAVNAEKGLSSHRR
ncbi:MAG: hypothetical protein IPM55_22895 [Acidobacteria bacterium]|nr:hypothetical protein [Acidobacteriota bacterium]